MKSTITRMMGVCAISLFSTGAFAQNNQLSLGVDLGIPLGDFGDFASFMVGPTAGFELPVGDKIGITLQAGYLLITPNSDVKDLVKSISAIPAQAGIKFYIAENQEGLYIHGQAGIHAMSIKTEEFDVIGITVPSETTTSTNFSWGIGGGFQLPKLDLGIRYNSISPDSDVDGASASTYIGIRAAFLLNLGG